MFRSQHLLMQALPRAWWSQPGMVLRKIAVHVELRNSLSAHCLHDAVVELPAAQS